MEYQETAPHPHVLIFPLPLQGPVNCMLKLAELLCLADFHVTFLNTHHIHRRLLSHTGIRSRFERYPNFHFEFISDGLPEDHPRFGERVMELLDSLKTVASPIFREMVTSGPLSPKSERPPTCIIADGFFSVAIDVAHEINVPLIYFDTISPSGVWTYLCFPRVIAAGEFPFKGNDLDAAITSVPGMEGLLRRRDLPSFYRVDDTNDLTVQLVLKEAQKLPQAKGLILNTFEELEGPLLSNMRTLCPNIYTIGSLHALFKSRLAQQKTSTPANSSNSLWAEDNDCIAWLDAQLPKSVIFVSIGSVVAITTDQRMEIWHGLVNSGTKFLWVRRAGSVIGEDKTNEIPAELWEGTKERGCIVSWAPQEEVLAHRAVGGFLTHSGWNSTLESIVEGVPMICWPHFVDQQVNSRYVEEVWKLGMYMKDRCDRVTVEKMVRELMEVRRDEFLERAEKIAELAEESFSEGGSSYCELDRLIEDIRSLSLQAFR